MTMTSKDPIAICWVPNIGGTVTTGIHDKINSKSIEVKGLVFTYFESDGCVEAKVGSDTVIIIKPIDGSGMCDIHTTDSDQTNPVVGSTDTIIIDHVWMGFSMLISGCSAICRCSAMERTIPYIDGMNRYDAVAMRFVDTFENIADSETYAKGFDKGSAQAHLRALNDEAVVRGNLIYFQRFVDLYHDKLGEKGIRNYTSQIHCRKDKIDLISDYNHESHMTGYTGRISELMTSLKTYTEGNYKLTRDIAEASKKSDRMSRTSLIIATISMLCTFAALVATYAELLST